MGGVRSEGGHASSTKKQKWADPDWLSSQRHFREKRIHEKTSMPPIYGRSGAGGSMSSKSLPKMLQTATFFERSQSMGALPKLASTHSGSFLSFPGDKSKEGDFEQQREARVRQASLVCTRVAYRQSLGWAARLPPPCDVVYTALPESMRPDPHELIERMHAGENYRSAMGVMLLAQFPNTPEHPQPPVLKPNNLSGLESLLQADDLRLQIDVRPWTDIVKKVAQPWKPADLRKSKESEEEKPKQTGGWGNLRNLVMDEEEEDIKDALSCVQDQLITVSQNLPLDPRWIGAAVLVYPNATTVSLAKVGAKDFALKMLHCWSRLRDLDLSKNVQLVAEDLLGLKNLPKLASLNVSGCPLLEDLINLQALPVLEHVTARDCERIVSVDEPERPPSAHQLSEEEEKHSPKRREQGDPPVLTGEMIVQEYLKATHPSRAMLRRDSADLGFAQNQVSKSRFAQKGPWRRPALIGSSTVCYLDIHGCHQLKILKLKLPSLTELDVAHMKSLRSIEGAMTSLRELNLSSCPSLEVIDTALWRSSPKLEDLTCCYAENLHSILGLHEATSLKRLRLCHCTALEVLEVPKNQYTHLDFDEDEEDEESVWDHGSCQHLLFADFHNCMALSDKEIWDFVACRLDPEFFKAGYRDISTVLGHVSKVMGKRVGTLHEGDVAKVVDFWRTDDGQLMYHLQSDEQVMVNDQQSPGRRGAIRQDKAKLVKRGCYIPASQDGVSMETDAFETAEKGALVVWPSRERAENFEPLGRAGMPGMLLEALRAKLRKAILALKKKASSLPVELAKEDTRKELIDSIERANGKVLDLPLLRSIFRRGCILDFAPDMRIKCLIGCGQEMSVQDYLEHEKICKSRREKNQAQFTIPYIGRAPEVIDVTVGVRADDMPHFNEVCGKLEEALMCWNCDKLKLAITNVCPPNHRLYPKKQCRCETCILPNEYMFEMEGRLRRLEDKFRIVHPITSKGNISVEFDDCTINVKTPIQFENRKPPDSSAALEKSKQKESEETLWDLAAVLKAYMEPMIIEGHTGKTDDPGQNYWGSLADNRSNLIATFLERCGVPQGICIPKGCPGGGAKVLVYPRDEKKKKAKIKV